MLPKVLSPEDVAKVLLLEPSEVVRAMERGEIPARRIAGQWRTTDEVLSQVLNLRWESSAIHSGATVAEGDSEQTAATGRRRDLEQERMARTWIRQRLGQLGPSLSPALPTKEFSVNGKQGILSIATMETPEGSGNFWFGLPRTLLGSSEPIFIIPVVAPRRLREPHAFVIPYLSYKTEIDGWSTDRNGNTKYSVREVAPGRYSLSGRGMVPIDITVYLGAFHLFK